ncbi:peptidylprolyl isomerase [Acinetobacter sp. DSM 11652]|uniref:peptidylprolyl isomerase n=1 Tax=Acinetobacter sp. DSM 11652 TaxID=346222 RepID=UPI0008CF79E4|nr:peptidylprolyl isomerase [Acinetobacter sp. DSM 11652]SEL32845.1 peptidyl-prolyl cis-trans isomerase SurA [Acinetobacter sp. DSM 11652]
MKMQNLKQLFKASAVALVISASVSSYANPSDQIVAIVGKSAILKSDIAQGVAELQHQLKAQKQDVPPLQVLENQALNKLIIQNAQLEQVKRYGIQVDEKTLNDAVLNVARQSNSNSLEDFQQKLDRMAPGTYENLRAKVADDLAIQRLRQQQVMSRIKISDQDVENFLKSPEGQAAVGTQAHVIHFRISGEASQQQLTQVAQQVQDALQASNDVDAIQKQFSTSTIKVEGADMGSRSIADIPEELASSIALVSPGNTTDLIQARDGIHLLKLLERKSNEKKTIVPQYQTRHILIKTSEVVSPENAKHTIDSIYSRVKAGDDFAVLAATYSNDPGSARDGGSLGWVSPGMMVPEFDQKMQTAKIGEVSEPFETQFGWHILQVTDARQQDMTQEQQKRIARQILGDRQFDAELDGWLRELRASTYVEIKQPNQN